MARLAERLDPTPKDKDHADPRQTALSTLIGAMPLRVILVDRDLRIIAASRPTSAAIGPAESDFIGRSIFDIDPEYFLPFAPLAQRCLAGETIISPRVRAREDGGEPVWLRTEISPWRDANGDIGGLISVSVEISEVMAALETSERSEQRLKMAVELADLHVWELDYASGALVTVGAEETFFDGSLSDAEIAADTNITIHPEDRTRVAEAWQAAVDSDTPFRPEYRINRQDGKEVWAACNVKLVRDAAGEPQRLIGAMQNITARKLAEAALIQARDDAEAANRAKSQFLATMSHEIRTPLNGVLGMAQAMAADDLAPTQRARLNTIRQSGETLLTVLNDVLDLSKIEAGKLELEMVDFDVAGLAQDVTSAFAGVAAGKSLTLALEVEDAARGRYRGDSGRLGQVLSNLVSNALKFTDAGSVRLHVSRRSDALVFTISDTGIGIPADRLPNLFQKFEQVDASTTRRFGGTGLGLAICRQLATLMDAEVQVSSQEGVGSQFQLIARLPRVGEESPAESALSTPAAPAHDGPAIRVLAAEDNNINRLVLRTLLEQAGIDPVIVCDGVEAVTAWRDQEWDIILMDVQMPVLDGPSATRAIRAAERATGRQRTPIVALTANAMAHQREEYIAAGMDGLIPKPIQVTELFAALQAALEVETPQNAAA